MEDAKDCAWFARLTGDDLEEIRAKRKEKQYVEVDTLGSQGCSGGICEITF